MSVRILYDTDTFDAATITSSSEAGDCVDDYAVDNYLGRPWRTTADSAEWIKFDLGGATNITCFSIFGHNLTAAATVTLEGNATDSWGAPSYSQALTVATDSDSVVLPRICMFLDETYRWWRLTIADAANPDTYVQLGRIKAGAYYQPARTLTDGYSIRWADPSEGNTIDGTLTHFRERTEYRVLTCDFRFAARTQADKMATILRKVGRRTPVVCAYEPADYPSFDTIYGTLSGAFEVTPLLTYYHIGPVTITEVSE